jgi:membrane protease YdiL (CAAX protease family)
VSAGVGAGEVAALEEDRIARALLGVAVVVVAVVDAALITRGHVLAGAIADGICLFFLLNFAAWQQRFGVSVAGSAETSAIHALVLVALARVVAAGMPVGGVSEPVADLMVALPVGYAAIRFARVVGLSVRGLFRAAGVQPLVGACFVRPEVDVPVVGGLLGLLAYLVGAPALATAESSVGRILLAVAAIMATVVVEELVFRGLLQTTLHRVAGRVGFIAAATLFASAYLAAGSASLVLTMALAGLVFGYGFARAGNLRSAVVGHYELAMGAFILWPILFGRSDAWLDGPVTTVILALAVVGAVAVVARQALPQAPR